MMGKAIVTLLNLWADLSNDTRFLMSFIISCFSAYAIGYTINTLLNLF
jgi:hypothetical protein